MRFIACCVSTIRTTDLLSRLWRGPQTAKPEPADEAPADPVAAGLEPIRLRFLDRLRADYEFLSQFRGAGDIRSPELIGIVHRMAGSAGLVGFPQVSEVAGRLDGALADAGDDPRALLEELLSLLRRTAFPADQPSG
jgi:HPt (histidine-containing phosphotransfer) domain-containing protein